MAVETLSPLVHAEISRLSEEGNACLDERDDPDGAARAWTAALDLLPEPKSRWEAWTWLHASLGSACREKEELPTAVSHFLAAREGPGGEDNPYILISLGSCLYDLGRTEEADEHLLRAYVLEGEELFEGYGGPYLQYLESKGLPPRG